MKWEVEEELASYKLTYGQANRLSPNLTSFLFRNHYPFPKFIDSKHSQVYTHFSHIEKVNSTMRVSRPNSAVFEKSNMMGVLSIND